jgi:hypothetical protein
MLELNAKILNTFISPAKSGKRKDGTAWNTDQAFKLQLIWKVPQPGGDIKMVTQDLTVSEECYKLCVGQPSRHIRIPVETYVIEGKLGMKAQEGAVVQFTDRPKPASAASA